MLNSPDRAAHLAALREYFAQPGQAPIDKGTLVTLLRQVWDKLDVADSAKMDSGKLDRLEDPQWEAPYLAFDVERHGGAAMGSKRGELQHWRVNLDTGDVAHTHGGFRNLKPNDPSLTQDQITRIVDDVIELAKNKAMDGRVKWLSDDRCHVVVGELIPDKGPKRTVAGRRKRFRALLIAGMRDAGWIETGRYIFRHS